MTDACSVSARSFQLIRDPKEIPTSAHTPGLHVTASLTMTTDAPHSADHDAAVHAFVEDFRRRVSLWDWWTDALFVSCSSPKGGGVYTSDLRVYLVGPASETLPVYAWRRETFRERVWISLLLPDAIDVLLEGKARATRPAATENEIQNFFAVHLARDDDQHVQVGYRWVHHPDVNTPGGHALADNLTWLYAAVADMQLDTPALP